MITPNMHYADLKDSYLFYNIAQKTKAYLEANPSEHLCRMGIGDVSLPLCDAVIRALHEAVDDQAAPERFHGYMPECGAPFLREAVAGYYERRGVVLSADEIFVSSGASDELGDILDLFDRKSSALVIEPAYPAYVDANVMAGRKIVRLTSGEENGFLPEPREDIEADLLYICSPNNPTGAVYTKEQLEKWVAYALEQNAVILFDSAYESFVRDDSLPTSIYAVEGAKNCAIEFCSFSKTAGFTGTRCGYTVVPNELEFGGVKLNKLWLRRQTTKFNGVPYIIQKGAAAVFTPEGQKQIRANIDYYMENARLVSETLNKMGIWHTGGKNSPYIWLKCPNGMKSWEYFDYLLEKAHVVGTPGAGFGVNGEGFFRLTAFNSRENVLEAVERIKKTL